MLPSFRDFKPLQEQMDKQNLAATRESDAQFKVIGSSMAGAIGRQMNPELDVRIISKQRARSSCGEGVKTSIPRWLGF